MHYHPLRHAAFGLLLGVICAAGVQAQTTMDHSKMNHGSMAAADATVLTDGEVKKVDAQAQTITLKHGDIKNIDMPAMTMVFKVKSAAMLTKVKAGDKVKFTADMPHGSLTLTSIELAR